jgi:hypothetical protein
VNLTQSDECGNSLAAGADPKCRLVWRQAGELVAHPSYLRNGLAVPVSKIAALRELGDLAFKEPIIVTRDRVIIDGYARWQTARKCGRKAVLCLEYDLSEIEALRWLIQSHFPSRGLSAYSRILLARDLRPSLRERALSNQQVGGRHRDPSNLTEAEKIDVRREIAKAAGVSVGNVTKFEQLRLTAGSAVLEALSRGEVRIHKAWGWRKMHPTQQTEQLRLHRLKRDLRQKVKTLISKHRVKEPSSGQPSLSVDDLSQLTQRLSRMVLEQIEELGPVVISLINLPGKGVFLTQELFDAISRDEGKP